VKYERIREIFNSCDNSKMRDVEIEEIECGDIDADVLQFCGGKDVSLEKNEAKDVTVFDISAGGLRQRISYQPAGSGGQ